MNVRHFEIFWGFLNTFLKKGKLLFGNLRLLKEIFRQVEAFLNKYVDFLKITRLF
jgi:hypothetical protein